MYKEFAPGESGISWSPTMGEFPKELIGTVLGEPTATNSAVITCECGNLYWGPHKSYCGCPVCKSIEKADLEAEVNKPTDGNYGRLKMTREEVIEAERQNRFKTLNRRVAKQNERELCTFYHGEKTCLSNNICQYCMKGQVYPSGVKDLSARRCPCHPVAGDGTRYIFRAAYRKDANGHKGFSGGEKYWVGYIKDNSGNTKYFKVPVDAGVSELERTLRELTEGQSGT